MCWEINPNQKDWTMIWNASKYKTAWLWAWTHHIAERETKILIGINFWFQTCLPLSLVDSSVLRCYWFVFLLCCWLCMSFVVNQFCLLPFSHTCTVSLLIIQVGCIPLSVLFVSHTDNTRLRFSLTWWTLVVTMLF